MAHNFRLLKRLFDTYRSDTYRSTIHHINIDSDNFCSHSCW